MASVKVVLRYDKTNKLGQRQVLIQIVHNRKKKVISLKHYIFESEWDAKTELAIEKSPVREHKIYLQKLNRTIVKRKEEIKQRILELDEKGIQYTTDMIITKTASISSNISFFKYTEQLINRFENLGKFGNASVYRQALNMFQKYRDEKDLAFEEFNYKMVIDFEEFLLKRGSKVNTVFTYMRKLKAVYNRAIKEEVVKEEFYPFKNYQIRNEKTTKRAILKENITAIKNLDLSDQTQIDARNIFLFSFYCRGITFIDIANLQVKNIVGDRLYYSRNKTKQKFSIRLTDQMFEIIKQYNDLKNLDSYIFPIIAEKDEDKYKKYLNALRLTNKKLKELGKMVGLSFPLTTYVARHSWATIAKRQGISTAVISEGLGHETERTTQIYLDSFENDVLDAANDLITNI